MPSNCCDPAGRCTWHWTSWLPAHREAMPASEAATRVGIVILASVVGMSFGGWVSGVIFDATGSYAAAFMNGLGWNALNITIMVGLLLRARSRLALA